MSDGPYLFDVGVTALAHTDAPVRDRALSYVRQAVAGEIDAIVPHASVVGAHNALISYYGISNERASQLMQNFMEAKRIHWYDGMAETVVRDGLSRASETNIGGWDGYYAQVAINEGVNTVLTIDDDLERFDAFVAEVILSPDEFSELNGFLGY
ncbi:hypothetical protein BRD03_12820 [Halobacteriales archaeon QS_9_68_17]|nr:MAG: hypothetical protein BRD03_12820 [Halobacteriales archaeon QS_9_68_17]